MTERKAFTALAVFLTACAVVIPLWWLLPNLHERAILAWHVGTFAEHVERSQFSVGLATLLLSVYIAALMVRFVAFVCASKIEAATIRSRQEAQPAPCPNLDIGCAWPLVSIVVPAYNEGPVIRASLRSLLNLDYPHFEVLVIDDGSSDDTYACALDVAVLDHRVRVIHKPNGGKSSALNLGLSQARGTLILNMDADSRVDSNALKVCVPHFRDPCVGAVAGNIKVANRENLATRLQAIEYIQGLALERLAQSAVNCVSVIGGPLGVFRRSALIEVGGYDPDTFAEDRDVTLKLLGRSWGIPYEPEARAWAESPSRWLDLVSQRYRWSRGTVQAIFKHSASMLQPRRQAVLFITLWYMALDSLVVPAVSLFMAMHFTYMALFVGQYEYLALWLALAMLFDVAITAYCIINDQEDLRLLPAALCMRHYTIFTDVCKILATLEELARVEMNWGKLTREGKI